MQCLFCNSKDTKVVETRESGEEVTRRRRECVKCGKRFTTYERPEMNIIVVKKNGTREQFNREKLKVGILKACEKREISDKQIEAILDKVERKLRGLGEREVKSKKVGDYVISELKRLDKVAYIRFASVYKDFEDVESFMEELGKLIKKRKK